MNKRKVLVGILASVCILTAGCGTATADNDNGSGSNSKDNLVRGKFELVRSYGVIYEVLDPDTGIHYYMGTSSSTSMLTPVIECDGTIRGATYPEY